MRLAAAYVVRVRPGFAMTLDEIEEALQHKPCQELHCSQPRSEFATSKLRSRQVEFIVCPEHLEAVISGHESEERALTRQGRCKAAPARSSPAKLATISVGNSRRPPRPARRPARRRWRGRPAGDAGPRSSSRRSAGRRSGGRRREVRPGPGSGSAAAATSGSASAHRAHDWAIQIQDHLPADYCGSGISVREVSPPRSAGPGVGQMSRRRGAK